MRLLIKFVFFLFLFKTIGYAQTNAYQFERIASEVYKVEKGLSQNSVNCIFQDSKGFIWFGTWDGLNKYDGYKFSYWNENIQDNKNSLSSSTIHAIAEDDDGYIWAGTDAGLNRYDRNSNKFKSFRPINGVNSISSDTIFEIVKDDYGNLWLGTSKGLSQYIIKKDTFINYYHKGSDQFSLCNNAINSMIIDKYGDLWIGTNNGLDKFDVYGNRFAHFNTANGLINNHVRDLSCDINGNLWIATSKGLSKLSVITNLIVNFHKIGNKTNTIPVNSISSVYADNFNEVWIGTDGGGLINYKISDNIFSTYLYESNNPESISNDFISCIYEDNLGIIWIGTSWKGLSKLVRNREKLPHYYHIPSQSNTLNSNLVWAFAEDKNNNLWIGTDMGINIFNKSENKFSVINNKPNNINSLASNQVRELFFEDEDMVWIGTFDKGISVLNISTGKFRHYPHIDDDVNSISHQSIWPIIKTSKGKILVGTQSGLNIYNKEADNFTRMMPNPKDPNSISNALIYALYEDSRGNIWIGTIDGLNKYNFETKKNVIYRHSPEIKNSISKNWIFSIFEDSKKRIWIGTMGGGLNRYFPETNTFKYYTVDQGLPNNVVYDIVEDAKGNLWITTNYGLSEFDPESEKFINYDIKDGVQGSEFNMGAAFKMKNGELAFGGMNGFNLFNPNSFNENGNAPNVVISSFKIFNKEQNKEFFDGDTITLNHYQNFLTFEFSAMDFINPSKNKYAYKLYPLVKEWVYTSSEKRTAEYTDLAPGTYKFKVKASNSDGKWNENGTTIVIVIKPAWYQTTLFKIGLIAIIIISLWLIIYTRIRQIRHKHEVEKKILEIEKQLFNLEQQALRLQMNPHFIFNSLNSIQSFVINNDTDKAIRYLSKFAQLMRMILSHSREAYIPIKDELKSLTYYIEIEQLRFNYKFDYIIEIDPNLDAEFMAIPPMIIQPYVENAIMHGIMHLKTKGLVTVKVKQFDELSIICTIEDNGVGREKALEIKNQSGIKHKSKGMIITKERLEILNKQNNTHVSVNVIDLKDTNNVSAGTKVEIIIPILDY